MIEVYNDTVNDSLENDPQSSVLEVNQDAKQNFLFRPCPQKKTCMTSSRARQVLMEGLKRRKTCTTASNDCSSRSHAIITIQPFLLNDDGKVEGGTITIVDMAGTERIKNSKVAGNALKESISINSTVAAVLSCLRVIKSNSKQCTNRQLVPHRQCKLTMALQPFFARTGCNTSITVLLSAYPGAKDYAEKKALLKEVDALTGLTIDTTACTTREITPLETTSSNRSIPYSRPATAPASAPPPAPPPSSNSHNNNQTIASPTGPPLEEMTNTTNTHTARASTPTSPTKSINSGPNWLKRTSMKLSHASPAKRKMRQENDELTERVTRLENENKTTKEENTRLKELVGSLTQENDHLKAKCDDQRRYIKCVMAKERRQVDLEREERRDRDQVFHPLVASSLHDHITKLRTVEDMKGPFVAASEVRDPFSLRVPRQWFDGSDEKENTAVNGDEKVLHPVKRIMPASINRRKDAPTVPLPVTYSNLKKPLVTEECCGYGSGNVSVKIKRFEGLKTMPVKDALCEV